MKVYCVGGAIRDELLGLKVQDRDWVVVGASPDMLLSKGYLPVGKDFPVFLHPQSHEEYALARTERKTGPGYRGFELHFDVSVTLEEDLMRRDLTINAMARAEDGTLIDPYGGQQDLEQKIFRHVSPAFKEDPVRVLRLARFAARFTDFSVAPETLALIRQLVQAGEISSLVAERVWQELARGLMAEKPSRMFALLAQTGALEVLAPVLAQAWDDPVLALRLDQGAAALLTLEQRFAILTHTLGSDVGSLCKAWRVPVECRDLAQLVASELNAVAQTASLEVTELAALIERLDAKRKPARFLDIVAVCEVLAKVDTSRLKQAQLLLAALDEAAIAKAQPDPATIREAIRRARVDVLRASLA